MPKRKKNRRDTYAHFERAAARAGLLIEKKNVRNGKKTVQRWRFQGTYGLVMEWYPQSGECWSPKAICTRKLFDKWRVLDLARKFAPTIKS